MGAVSARGAARGTPLGVGSRHLGGAVSRTLRTPAVPSDGATPGWDLVPMTESTPTPRNRIPLIVGGSVASIVAAGLLAVGGLALWADGKKDHDGYVSTSSHQFSAPTAALASGNIDLDGVSWLADRVGKARVKVTPQTGKPVFVGIARTRDVSAYLRGVAHTEVDDIKDTPFSGSFDVTYRGHGGKRRATPPAGRHIWAASAQGATAQTLTWDADDGNWSVVVMNADGSPGIQARISAGARAPFLAAVGWTAIGVGTLVAAGAVWMFVLAGRRRPTATRAAVAPVYSAVVGCSSPARASSSSTICCCSASRAPWASS